MTLFDFAAGDDIGVVFSVDTGTVTVCVTDEQKLRTLQVNQLVAIRSSKAGQHLVGTISKITRKAAIPQTDQEDEHDAPAPLVENWMRVLLVGTHLDAEGTRRNAFRRSMETVPEIDAEVFVLAGDRLTNFMRALSHASESSKHALQIGAYAIDEAAEAFLDGDKLFQRHAAIVGSTGSGKSCTVATIVEQAAKLPNVSALLFDLHGEYEPLVGPGVSRLKIAGPGDLEGGKGLSAGVLHLPYWLLTYEEMLSMMLDRSDQNAPNQAMVLKREILDAKARQLAAEDDKDLEACFTIDSPVPYSLKAVRDRLEELDQEQVEGARKGTTKAGPFNGKLTRFVQRLDSRRTDRRLGFLFEPPEHTEAMDWLDKAAEALLGGTKLRSDGGVKIVDFSEVPSDILPLVAGLVARVVFSVQQWISKEERHPVALLCDEAHLYIPDSIEAGPAREGLQAFERVAKEGRKYGVALVVISQRPSEVNRTVLSQCGNFVAMRLTNAEDQSVVRRLLPDTLGGFADLLPILDVGEAVVVGDAALLPCRVRVRRPSREPASTSVPIWSRWGETTKQGGIAKGVRALRMQQSEAPPIT